MKVSGSDVEE